jgi:hypothetical protein
MLNPHWLNAEPWRQCGRIIVVPGLGTNRSPGLRLLVGPESNRTSGVRLARRERELLNYLSMGSERRTQVAQVAHVLPVFCGVDTTASGEQGTARMKG